MLASKMSAPRGEREKADARRNGVEHPKVSTTASNSASDTDAPAATGGRRERKPLGFYRVYRHLFEQDVEMLRCRECKRLLHRHPFCPY